MMLSQVRNNTSIFCQPQYNLHGCDEMDMLLNRPLTEEDIYSNIHLYPHLAAKLVASKVSESVLNGLVRDGLITEQQREEMRCRSIDKG